MIQTDSMIHLYDFEKGDKDPTTYEGTTLCDVTMTIKMEMHRGYDNCFYYTTRDNGTSGDSLQEYKLY